MISIIDYGLGNLKSIAGALERIGVEYNCTRDISVLRQSRGFILPGVGAFPDGIKNLHSYGITKIINERVISNKVPFLGICLGFQLLATIGTEFENCSGLDWIRGTVLKLEPKTKDFKIPHVGWNEINHVKKSILFENIPTSSLFYFTHSYHLVPQNSEVITATCDNGEPFVAAIESGRIFGTQFHPEKSQKDGLEILTNFCKFTSQC